jgi:hypothetical protein
MARGDDPVSCVGAGATRPVVARRKRAGTIARSERRDDQIRLSDFRIFGREALVDEVVSLLADGIVVEHKSGEWQIVADGCVEIGDVHHERNICGEMGNALAGPGKAGAERNAQALPNHAKIRSE